MTTQNPPLAEITETAIRTLCREIGVVNTIRFLNQFSPGTGNYTEERRHRFDDKPLEDIFDEIKANRSIKSAKRSTSVGRKTKPRAKSTLGNKSQRAATVK